MYFVKSPFLLSRIYQRNEIWNVVTDEKVIYLTFDDGPVQEITPWVLEVLEKYHARATFFCVGENVKKNPKIAEQIIKCGHALGNHTFNHLNGWFTSLQDYVNNVRKCNEYFSTNLFRPPYGRIKKSQAEALRNEFVMFFWSVLSGDFDREITPQKCYNNVVQNTRPGSIVVFHDSLKAWKNLRMVLPAYLKHFSERGYKFNVLSEKLRKNTGYQPVYKIATGF